jgi:hypothetical protein
VGCHKGLWRDTAQHQCVFMRKGFTLEGVTFEPCGTTYHLGCICMGEPFRTRLPNHQGLQYPRVRISPPFICKACTVRAQIGRELDKSGRDLTLLMLERMRMIDQQANAWSQGTHQNYQAHLGKLDRFQEAYSVPILVPTEMKHPPRHPSIGIMWVQQHYALQTPTKAHMQSTDRIHFDSMRALRSATSQYYLWDYQVAHPGQTMRDPQTKKVNLVQGVSPTNAVGYTCQDWEDCTKEKGAGRNRTCHHGKTCATGPTRATLPPCSNPST